MCFNVLYLQSQTKKTKTMTQVNVTIDYDLLADKVAERIAGHNSDKGGTTDKGRRIDGIRGLAAYMMCSPSKVQNMKNEGLLPFYEIGRKVFFYTAEIDEALKREGK